MGNKIRPDSHRLGVTQTWDSSWFFKKSKKFFLKEDCLIREYLNESLENAGIDKVNIERTQDNVNISIKSNRPGLIIGRKGSRVEEMRNELTKKMKKLREEDDIDTDFKLNLNVVELRRDEVSASVVADQVAADLERRVPFRRVMKRRLGGLEKNRDVEGAKIQVAGRLNGSDFARTEWLDFGKMPLGTFRANIDYGDSTANTTYGSIGVKVWIYTGKVFDEDQEDNK